MARVLLFGPLRDLAGWRERDGVEAASIGALKALLAKEDARLGEALSGPGVQVALDQAVAANAEVAFLPPMSGG